jgi:hypothetical protein
MQLKIDGMLRDSLFEDLAGLLELARAVQLAGPVQRVAVSGLERDYQDSQNQ